MPNWCNNTLTITGDKTIRTNLLKKAKHGGQCGRGEKFAFGAFFPLPEELKDTRSPAEVVPDGQDMKNYPIGAIYKSHSDDLIAKYGYNNWYDWQTKNWGVKWDADNAQIESHAKYKTIVSFDTAWCPPEVAIKRIASLYPDLEFDLYYSEPGMGFAGRLVVKGDEVISDEELPYPEDAENED